MPTRFLTDEQLATYGRYAAGPLDQAVLERFFFLDDADRDLVAKRRGDHSRLGFALQLVTVRHVGAFLGDPLDVPPVVLDYVAAQIGVADPSCVKRYTERDKTRLEHQWEIAEVDGFASFASAEAGLVQRKLKSWADPSRVRYATVLQAGEQYCWGRLLRAFVWRNCWEHFGFAQERLSASTQAMKSMATESIEARTQVNSRQINDSRAVPSKTRSRDLTSPRRSAATRASAALRLAHLAARRAASARAKISSVAKCRANQTELVELRS